MTHPKSSRRAFLLRAASAAAFAIPILRGRNPMLAGAQGSLRSGDKSIILNRLQRAEKEDNLLLPVGDLVAGMGRSFLGYPYTANTLEEQGEEHLVVNLHEFDCVTLCETSLALARAARLHGNTADAYCAQLRLVRYRSGTIDGYSSRLHYFSEWIADNAGKKVVTDMARELGGREDRRPLNFMSSHRGSYPGLTGDVDAAEITSIEKRLSTLPRYFLPKTQVDGILEKLRSGDIIAITTLVEGLDVTHTGIAVKEGGTIRLLHAPNVGKRVQITAGSLSDYLKAHEKDTGIMVARPVDPIT